MSTINEPTNELATNSFQAQSIDCAGTTYAKPVMWRTRLAAAIAALVILLGVFLYFQGLFSIGIALITACLACLAILGIVVRVSAAPFLGRQDMPSEDNPLGCYLSSNKASIKLSTPTLSDEEAANIDLHRATEAVLVNEWVVNARTPRRIQVRSDDGTALAGRMIPGTKRLRPWVLMLHEFGGSWRDSLAFSRIYAAHDCNIMLVDMRAHGESEGEWAGSGWLDRRDVIAWCSWIIARTGEETQIIIHGVGMGATAALFAAEEEDFPIQVRAIVGDSAYTDVWNETALRLGEGFAKPQPMLDLYRIMLEKSKGGYDLGEGNALPGIQSISTPLFIMHGEEDACTPPYMGMYLAKAAGCDVDTILDVVTAKQVMADISNLKAKALYLASQETAHNSSNNETQLDNTPRTEINGNQSEAPATNAINNANEAEDKLAASSPITASSTVKTEMTTTNADEIRPLTTDQPNTTDLIAESGKDTATEANSNDKTPRNHDDTSCTRSEVVSQETTEHFHEDDLSDLIVDQPTAEDDPLTRPEASPYISTSMTGNVFFFAPSAGHCQASFACPTSYENALNDFLNRCIG